MRSTLSEGRAGQLRSPLSASASASAKRVSAALQRQAMAKQWQLRSLQSFRSSIPDLKRVLLFISFHYLSDRSEY